MENQDRDTTQEAPVSTTEMIPADTAPMPEPPLPGGSVTPPDPNALIAALEQQDEEPLPSPKDGTVELLVPAGDITAVQARELTGRDEEALSRVLLGKGDAAVIAYTNEIARRGLGMIRKGLVWTEQFKADEVVNQLTLGDRDRLVNMVRDVTFGAEIELTATCFNCQRILDMTYDVHEPPVREADPEATTWSSPSGKQYTLRWITVEDQEFTYGTGAATMEERNTLYMQRSVVAIDGMPPRNSQWALDLGLRERRALVAHITDHTPGLLFEEVTADCSCGAEVPIVVSPLQLFR